jgi:glutamyl-tRNA reductase
MHLIIAGLNHKTASVEIRDRIHFPTETIQEAYEILNTYPSIKGSVILSTCNRVEIYASVEKVDDAFDEIEEFICKFNNVNRDEVHNNFYKKRCEQAVMHLFKVASGLDSMVIGEYQVQGQVRDAYFRAFELNKTSKLLNKAFQTTINIGKKVRSETEIGKGSVSIATLAVDLIKQIFECPHNLKTLLIGAGEISTLTAANLKQLNSTITISNRSKENAEKLAERFDGKTVDYENRYKAILENDIIIVSTSSKEYTVSKQELSELPELKNGGSRIFLDLSIPRNIDPEINTLENCLLYSIDDINKIVTSNISKRSQEVDKAEKIIAEIADEYYEWYSKQFIIPTMQDLKKRLEVLKEKTILEHSSTYNAFTEEQQVLINELMNSYSDKLIKVLMTNIKKATTNEDIIAITNTLRDSFSME